MKQAHLDEPCIKCKAAPTERCTTASGRPTDKPHADRIHNGNMLFKERLESDYYNQNWQPRQS